MTEDVELTPEEQEQWQEWVEHVRVDVLDQMIESAMVISIFPRDPRNLDIKYALELGMSIMLEKPIILVVMSGTKLPKKLEALADAVIVTDGIDDEKGQVVLKAAIDETLRNLDEDRKKADAEEEK